MDKQIEDAELSEKYPKTYIVGLILALFIFIFSLIVSRSHSVSGFQLNLFHDVNNWPDSLKTPAVWLTQSLAIYAIPVVIIVPAIWRYWRLAWRFFVTIGAAGVLTEIAKQLVHEPRPVAMLHGNAHFRVIENGLNGFPSAHEAVATAMALTLWLILPRSWRWLSLVWIIVVGLSRLYLGVHTPDDILGGFALGLLAVCVVRLLPPALARPLRLQTGKLLDRKS